MTANINETTGITTSSQPTISSTLSGAWRYGKVKVQKASEATANVFNKAVSGIKIGAHRVWELRKNRTAQIVAGTAVAVVATTLTVALSVFCYKKLKDRREASIKALESDKTTVAAPAQVKASKKTSSVDFSADEAFARALQEQFDAEDKAEQERSDLELAKKLQQEDFAKDEEFARKLQQEESPDDAEFAKKVANGDFDALSAL